MFLYRLFCLLAIALLSACEGNKQTASPYPPRPVKVTQVEALGTINKLYTGIVQAEEFSILAFKVSGSLIALNVNEGQKINKGEVIARIDPFDYELQYATAQGAYNTTKSIYERNKRLFDQNAVAAQSLEIAEADYVKASSALNIAQRTLDYTRLTAPFSGIIEKKYAENFQKILVGESIVKLVNTNALEIYFILPETSIGLIEVPKTIFVEFDTQRGKLFAAGIKEYIYASDGSGIPITLKITDAEFDTYRKDVLPGFSCKVYFKLENTVSDNFILPASALFQEQEKEYVWTINPQTLVANRQEVKTIKFDNYALVKEGLNSEDLIVTAGVPSIKDGQRVRILNQQTIN